MIVGEGTLFFGGDRKLSTLETSDNLETIYGFLRF